MIVRVVFLDFCCVCPSLHFLRVWVFKYFLRMSGFVMVMSVSVCDTSDLLSVVDVRLILQISRVCLQAFSVLVLQFFSVALPVLGLRRVCVYSRCPASSKN